MSGKAIKSTGKSKASSNTARLLKAVCHSLMVSTKTRLNASPLIRVASRLFCYRLVVDWAAQGQVAPEEVECQQLLLTAPDRHLPGNRSVRQPQTNQRQLQPGAVPLQRWLHVFP